MASRKLFSMKPKYIYPVEEQEIMSENDDNVFEFDESDIHHIGDHRSPNSFDVKRSVSISRRKPKKTGDFNDNRVIPKTGSLPVNIPDWSKILKSEYRGHEVVHDDDSDDDEDDDDDGDGDTTEIGGRKIIPPHEYLARRRGSSFTVHETAKGRDLRRLRNAVWEKIGFQD